MSIYQLLVEKGSKYIAKHKLFKYGFNFSPMYRRSTGRVLEVAEDLMLIKLVVPISYRNRNYVGSIFGGSMFSAVDPFPMVQLINLLGEDYVVWDKSAEVFFKRPAKQNLYAEFTYTSTELGQIKQQVQENKEITIVKATQLTDKSGGTVYCEVRKTLYVADKEFYKAKRLKKQAQAVG